MPISPPSPTADNHVLTEDDTFVDTEVADDVGDHDDVDDPVTTRADADELANSEELAYIRQQVVTAATAAAAKMATDVAILHVGPLLGITDFFVVLSTTNDRQLGSAIDEIETRLREDHARKPIGREGQKESGWVVLDYGDFVVHGFTADQRDVYDLERLWGDAGRVPFTDPGQPTAAPG